MVGSDAGGAVGLIGGCEPTFLAQVQPATPSCSSDPAASPAAHCCLRPTMLARLLWARSLLPTQPPPHTHHPTQPARALQLLGEFSQADPEEQEEMYGSGGTPYTPFLGMLQVGWGGDCGGMHAEACWLSATRVPWPGQAAGGLALLCVLLMNSIVAPGRAPALPCLAPPQQHHFRRAYQLGPQRPLCNPGPLPASLPAVCAGSPGGACRAAHQPRRGGPPPARAPQAAALPQVLRGRDRRAPHTGGVWVGGWVGICCGMEWCGP